MLYKYIYKYTVTFVSHKKPQRKVKKLKNETANIIDFVRNQWKDHNNQCVGSSPDDGVSKWQWENNVAIWKGLLVVMIHK